MPTLSRLSIVAVGAVLLAMLPAVGSAAYPTAFDSITTGPGARDVAFAPNGRFAYVANENDDTVSVIDVIAGSVVQTVAVGDQPIGIAVTPDGSEVWVANFANGTGAGTATRIRTSDNTVVGTPVPAGLGATKIVFSPDGSTAWIANDRELVSGEFGTISVIRMSDHVETDTITIGGYPESIAISPDGSKIYATRYNGASVAVVDTQTLGVTLITGITRPTKTSFSPDGTKAYVITEGVDLASPSMIHVINTATQAITSSFSAIGFGSYDITVTPDGASAYAVFGSGLKGVRLITLATQSVGAVITAGNDPQTLAIAPAGNMAYLVDHGLSGVYLVKEGITRVSGSDRYATSAAISQQAFPAGANTIFIATGLNYPDALSAGPAAASMNAPLLLTEPGVLPAVIKAEVQRLKPTDIYVIGSSSVVSNAVLAELDAIATGTVTRIGGVDRFDTSRKVTELAFGASGAGDVYIATGLNFPDALTASGVGATFGNPVILVPGTAAAVDQATLDLLDTLNAVNVMIAGSTTVVSSGIQTQLSGTPGILSVTRLAGANRYETGLAIVQAQVGSGYTSPVTRVFLATGENFPDALSGSAMAGALRAPLFIVRPDCIPQDVINTINALGAQQITMIGSSVVLKDTAATTPC